LVEIVLAINEIQVSSNIGPGPLQREDNHKNVKIGWVRLKVIGRTIEPEKLIFT
jgi:hypothetical protein